MKFWVLACAALVSSLTTANCKDDKKSGSFSHTPVPSSCHHRKFKTDEPTLAEIKETAAKAKTANYKGVKYVPGKAFDRIFIAWLENTDYDKAMGQEDMKKLAKEGVTLTNYWAVTHPSQPNYLASAGGDYFGGDDDEFIQVPKNIFSVADLLDSKNISWAEYQEHSPYSGFQGFNFSNQETYANDYVRKHNPLIMYENIETDEDRRANIKNFTEFDHDVANDALPQWAFITPNMTNDGHDTSIKVSGKWSYDFFSKLLKNEYYTKNSLTILTFDENETYEIENKVAAILIGDIPDHLKGTKDDTYYDHYSLLATVQNNWELPNLGRHDCGANVLQIVADKTGYKNKKVDTTGQFNNQSAPGPLNCKAMEWTKPDLKCKGAGGPVLQKIVDAWKDDDDEDKD